MTLEAGSTDALDDDLFAAGFEEGLGGEVPAIPDTPTAETPVEPAPAEPTPAAPVEPTPAAPAEPTPAATASPVDIKALIAEALAEGKQPNTEQDAAPALSQEELEAEEQYRKDWPEHAAREDRLKAQLAEVKTLLAETTKAIQAQIQPVMQSAQASAEEKHYNTILTAHPDANSIAPEVVKWIATQPKFLRPQYNSVLEQGTAEDVIELFSTYKSLSTPQTPTPPVVPNDAEAESRIKRMTTPESVRTSVTAEEDPDDFDGAFDAIAKKMKL